MQKITLVVERRSTVSIGMEVSADDLEAIKSGETPISHEELWKLTEDPDDESIDWAVLDSDGRVIVDWE